MKNCLCLFFCVVLILCLVAACGTPSPEPAPAQPNAPAPAEPDAPAAEPAAPAPAGTDPVSISFQYIGGTVPAVDEVIAETIAFFEAANPHITVSPIFVNWGNAHSQFVNSVMAGMAPDVSQLAGTWCLEFIDKGAFAPIADYVDAAIIDTWLPSSYEIMIGADGLLYGSPLDGCSWGFFYRTDLFEEAGINGPPTTWDEFLDYGKQLSGGGKYGVTMALAGWEASQYYLPYVWQTGAQIYNESGGEFTPNFDDPNVMMGTKFFYDLFNTHRIASQDVTGLDWEGSMKVFAEGDAAMMFNGMWVVNTLRSGYPEIDGKWATALNPVGPNGVVTGLSYPNTLHITSQSQHKDVAGQFLNTFYGEGFYERFCMESGVFATTKDFINLDYSSDPLLKPFIELSTLNAHNFPAAPKYQEFRDIYFEAGIQALALNMVSPEEFAKQMSDGFSTFH